MLPYWIDRKLHFFPQYVSVLLREIQLRHVLWFTDPMFIFLWNKNFVWQNWGTGFSCKERICKVTTHEQFGVAGIDTIFLRNFKFRILAYEIKRCNRVVVNSSTRLKSSSFEFYICKLELRNGCWTFTTMMMNEKMKWNSYAFHF